MTTPVPVLTVETVPAYLRTRADLASVLDVSSVRVREIGDGNLNLVFIAVDGSGRGVVLKQSLPYVRMVGESWPLSQDRILAEARGYDAASKLSPGSTPAYHGLDAERRLIAVEDLSDWTVWRTALNAGRITPGAAAALGEHVAAVAFGTSAFALAPEEVKAAAAASINPELCRITEDLVLTEPYIDHPHNEWDAELTPDVLALREGGLVDEVAQLKHAFLTRAEALIHGDLHTGSVFVPGGAIGQRESAAKVFDIEFSFYGPVGFDLGALFGNYLLAQSRARVLGRPPEFGEWLATLADETWTAFEAEFRRRWPSRIDSSFTDRFLEHWLRQVWADAVGFGGAKAIRRIVGMAKASDIQTLPTDQRVRAARAVLAVGRAWIEGRREVSGPGDLATLTSALLAEELV